MEEQPLVNAEYETIELSQSSLPNLILLISPRDLDVPIKPTLSERPASFCPFEPPSFDESLDDEFNDLHLQRMQFYRDIPNHIHHIKTTFSRRNIILSSVNLSSIKHWWLGTAAQWRDRLERTFESDPVLDEAAIAAIMAELTAVRIENYDWNADFVIRCGFTDREGNILHRVLEFFN